MAISCGSSGENCDVCSSCGCCCCCWGNNGAWEDRTVVKDSDVNIGRDVKCWSFRRVVRDSDTNDMNDGSDFGIADILDADVSILGTSVRDSASGSGSTSGDLNDKGSCKVGGV